MGQMKFKHTATKTNHYSLKQNNENWLGLQTNYNNKTEQLLKNPVYTSLTIIPLPIDFLCVCVCVYIYIYIYTHTHTHTNIICFTLNSS